MNEQFKEQKALSLGERRVRINFNVSGDTKIDQIKKAGADFINLIDSIPIPDKEKDNPGEFLRLKALALTAAEEATQWIVKAITI